MVAASSVLCVVQSDHTTVTQVTAALETEHSQPCPNYHLTIICPEIKPLPLLFPLVNRMEGKRTKIARKSSFLLPIPCQDTWLLGRKLGKGSPEHAAGADFPHLLISLLVLLSPPESCFSQAPQHLSAENWSRTISLCEQVSAAVVTITAILRLHQPCWS